MPELALSPPATVMVILEEDVISEGALGIPFLDHIQH